MKKTVAICLMALILVLGLAIPVSANQNRSANFSKNYSLTSDPGTNMVNIAKAQVGKTGANLGYTESWCSNFVSDCARLSGQTAAIGDTAWCPTLASHIRSAGGTVVVGTNVITTPKPGDIIFFGDVDYPALVGSERHVGIVSQVSGNIFYTIEGNSTTASEYPGLSAAQVVSSRADWTYHSYYYIIRPNYGGGTVHTHNYTLKGYEYAHPHKEYLYCSCNQIKPSNPYTGNISYTSRSCCSIGGMSVSTGAKNYCHKDDIVFNMSGTNVKNYTLNIYRDGILVNSIATTGKTLTRYNLEPGVYTAKVTGSNDYFSATSSATSFTIQPKLSSLYDSNGVSISRENKPSAYPTKGFSFSPTGLVTSNSDIKYVLVDIKNSAGNLATGKSVFPGAGVRQYNIANLASGIKTTGLGVGSYTYIVRVKNDSGVSEVIRHCFCVVNSCDDTRLAKPTVSLDTNIVQTGDFVNVSWNNVSGATSYIVNLIQAPWGWANVKENAITKDNYYSFKITEPGEYKIFVVARNGNAQYTGPQSAWHTVQAVSKLDASSCKLVASKKYDGKIYELYDHSSNWYNARNLANAMGGNLVTITSKEEHDVVYSLISESGTRPCYWLWGTNFCNVNGNYSWGSGESFGSYTAWHTNEPSGGREHWLSMYKSNGKWNDVMSWGSQLKSSNMGFVVEKNDPTASAPVTPDNPSTPDSPSIPDNPADGSKFTDISDDAWYVNYVYDLVSEGILDGKGDGKFDPLGNIKRSEFAKILAFASGDDLEQYTGKTSFNDVPTGKWFSNPIEWAYEKGIVKGVDEGEYAPDAQITRQDMALMITRYADYKGISLPQAEAQVVFADDGQIGSWAKDAVTAMQRAGIISGKGDNRFAPKENANRAEASKMISMLLDL